MRYRTLGKTNWKISSISLGTWQVGGRWGEPFDAANAKRILHEAIDRGVNFIDTADVYSDGLSEKIVGEVVRSRAEQVYVATKCGRRLQPHTADAYTAAALRGFVEDSLRNSGLETIDLLQLHCPPTEVYYRPEIFALFERLRDEGKIQHLGVSVEKVEEALKAINYPNVASVQIIFNMFRQRPAELFFREAQTKDVGIIVRVPLASGLLSGKFTAETVFSADDHRQSNRQGEHFDKGETFSGVDYNRGLAAVGQLAELFGGKTHLAQRALQWVLAFPEVSCVIPGASRLEQVISNISTEELAPMTKEQFDGVRQIYQEYIQAEVHHLW